jgi:hypothetical protein
MKLLHAGKSSVTRWLEKREFFYEFEPEWGVRTRPDFRV